MTRKAKLGAIFGVAVAAFLILVRSALNVTAAPPAQNPTPTEEPTKRPYIFPTPIFIPTYASATDLPRRVTAIPAATISLAGAQSYTVEAGDNPSIIAKKVYGDAGKFRIIVEANNLTDTTRLRTGMTLIIPPLTPIVPTQAPAAPTPPAPSTPTASLPDLSAIPEPTEMPEAGPEPESDTASLASAAENALYAMAIVLFLGFLAISGTTFIIYRRSKRAEKIAVIKQHLTPE